MAVSSVIYPASLPCVSRIDGYSLVHSASLMRTPFEAGNARQRRWNTVMPSEIQFAWKCSNEQLQPLFAWLNTYGYDWFQLDLSSMESSLADVLAVATDVRLTSDLTITLLPIHFQNWWLVSASGASYMPTEPALADEIGPVEPPPPGPSEAKLILTFDSAVVPFKDYSLNDFTADVTGAWTQGAGVISSDLTNVQWIIDYGPDAVLAHDTAIGYTLEARATCNTNPGLGGDALYAAFYDCDSFTTPRLELIPPYPATDWQWRVTLSGPPTLVGPHFAFHTYSHIALVVPPGTTPTARVYVDGTLVTTITYTPGPTPTASCSVQRQANPFATGLSVDYVRLSSGEVYTADFTPPDSGDLVP
jgi:hypothetical protein